MEESTLHGLFLNTAETYPNRIALTYEYNDYQEHVTYRELSRRANSISSVLGELRIHESDVVALYSRQFPALYACMLGILQRPSAFAPLCTEWPVKMACDFLIRLKARAIIVDVTLWSQFEEIAQKKLESPESNEDYILQESQDLQNLGFAVLIDPAHHRKSSISHMAYVMHTSGTTGEPKLVNVPHQCIVPNILDLKSRFNITEHDSVAVISPYTFDPFVVQLFLALSSGGRAVIVSDAVKQQPEKLCDFLFRRQKITILQPTPSLMINIGSELIGSRILGQHSLLRILALGGESCPPLSTLQKWAHPSCKTRIFNLYGITEVSSWASCHELSLEHAVNPANHVEGLQLAKPLDLCDNIPLGTPLMDTIMEVRNEDGVKISEGLGQVFIGGINRVCILGHEIRAQPGTVRATGDMGYIRNDQIWYYGRKDRTIKRQGRRINLLWIEQVLAREIPTAAFVTVVERTSVGLILHLFFMTSNDRHENLISIVKATLNESLPRYAHPDHIHLVTRLPVNSHGKVDSLALLQSIQRDAMKNVLMPVRDAVARYWLRSIGNDGSFNNRESNREIIYGSVDEGGESSSYNKSECSSTSNNCDGFVNDDAMFIHNGGTSIKAIQLANSLEMWLKEKHHERTIGLPHLLDVILNQSFGSLCAYIEDKSQSFSGIGSRESIAVGDVLGPAPEDDVESSFSQYEENQGRDGRTKEKQQEQGELNDAGTPEDGEAMHLTSRKRIKLHPENTDSLPPDVIQRNTSHCFCSVRRGMQCTICKNCSKAFLVEPVNSDGLNPDAIVPKTAPVQFRRKWSSDLYKCIDASPLVVGAGRHNEGVSSESVGNDAPLVYIGSHAHVMKAVRLPDGKTLWECTLGDRIESSAVLSSCGLYVIVGCYDGKIYVLDRHTGLISWTFQTGGQVKSSPCVDPSAGLVWFGSHDHRLYALDVTRSTCACVIECGGSCFASPCVDNTRGTVYCATLCGEILAVDAIQHRVSWTKMCPKPIFASPLASPFGVACGCVDGTLYALDHQGNALWEFHATGPIFSSPVYCEVHRPGKANVEGILLFGSHDSYIYCVSCTGTLKWKFQADSPIYSAPFVAANKASYGDVMTQPSLLPSDFQGNINRDIPSVPAKTRDSIIAAQRGGFAVRDIKNALRPFGNTISDATNVPVSFKNTTGTSYLDSDGLTEPPNTAVNEDENKHFPAKDQGNLGAVFVCSTSGSLYALSPANGELLGSYSLPGEVFSSPVLIKDTLVVGCRDDNLYALEVQSLEDS